MEVTALSAWVFWGSLTVIAYVYLGYPILLALWSRLAARRGARRAAAAGPRDLPPGKTAAPLPPISIIVVARNEASRLPQRIDNLLSLEYPAPREIIVVSDGSSDDTPGVLARYGSRVQVAMLPARGKWAALNHGVTLAR
ncbi:MAG: glycosyltransferase, partial [Vicinamibacterales bacterium]